MNHYLTALLAFYGSFLILCGVTAVIFIGIKAKTALLSGGTSGSILIVTSYLISQNVPGIYLVGLTVTAGLVIVFSWRATKTLFTLFQMIPDKHPDVKGKGIAFLIISLMAVMSIVVLGAQIVLLFG